MRRPRIIPHVSSRYNGVKVFETLFEDATLDQVQTWLNVTRNTGDKHERKLAFNAWHEKRREGRPSADLTDTEMEAIWSALYDRWFYVKHNGDLEECTGAWDLGVYAEDLQEIYGWSEELSDAVLFAMGDFGHFQGNPDHGYQFGDSFKDEDFLRDFFGIQEVA